MRLGSMAGLSQTTSLVWPFDGILRYSLSYRDLEEIMAERGVSVDHSTTWRWVDHYAPEWSDACVRI